MKDGKICIMESNTPTQLFVYSSLRVGFQDKAYDYISHHFHFVCNGKVKGTLHHTGRYPVGTPTPDNAFIKGQLYKLNDNNYFSWAFGQLDDYEDVAPDPGDQALYHREIVTVYKEDGGTTEAWIYWYNGDITEMPVIASDDINEY